MAKTGARIMGSVPSMNGKAKETALWMRDMRLWGWARGPLLQRLTRRWQSCRKYFAATLAVL
jgi:hypothetical protein